MFTGLPKGVTATGTADNGTVTFTADSDEKTIDANGTYPVTVRWVDGTGNVKYQDSVDVKVELPASGAVTDNTSMLKTNTKKLTVKVNITAPLTGAKVKITKIEPDSSAAPAKALSWAVPVDGGEKPAAAAVDFDVIDATDTGNSTILAANKKLKVTGEVSKSGRKTVTQALEVASTD